MEKELKEFTFACIDKAVQAGIARISVQKGDFSLTIETQGAHAPAAQPTVHTAAPEKPKPTQPEGRIVPAPLVGTFYAAAAPDQPPMVQVGDQVKKGDALCILEAMKVMNTIESPCDGTILRVMAVNGDLVEYNQPLFEVKEMT